MSDCDKFLPLINYALKEAVPTVNQALPAIITGSGLDPLASVTSGGFGPWDLKLDYVTVSIGGNYTVTNLTGLSSAQIQSFSVASCSGTAAAFQATLAYAIAMGAPLTASWSGTLSGSAGPVHVSTGISGTVTASDVGATGEAALTGGVAGSEVTLQSLQLTSFGISWESIAATVNGLPSELNSLLGDLTSTLTDAFGSWITSYLNSQAESAINSGLDKVFPLSFKVPS